MYTHPPKSPLYQYPPSQISTYLISFKYTFFQIPACPSTHLLGSLSNTHPIKSPCTQSPPSQIPTQSKCNPLNPHSQISIHSMPTLSIMTHSNPHSLSTHPLKTQPLKPRPLCTFAFNYPSFQIQTKLLFLFKFVYC